MTKKQKKKQRKKIIFRGYTIVGDADYRVDIINFIKNGCKNPDSKNGWDLLKKRFIQSV